jgi:hypothetical protein
MEIMLHMLKLHTKKTMTSMNYFLNNFSYSETNDESVSKRIS